MMLVIKVNNVSNQGQLCLRSRSNMVAIKVKDVSNHGQRC